MGLIEMNTVEEAILALIVSYNLSRHSVNLDYTKNLKKILFLLLFSDVVFSILLFSDVVFSMLINVKMSTTVGILTFMITLNLCSVWLSMKKVL